MLADKEFTKKKNRIKYIRTLLQVVVILIALFFVAQYLFSFEKYQPYSKQAVSDRDRGFVALSYFGVDRLGKDTLIAKSMLRAHLQAMQDNGYVTISQKDVEDYYKHGKKLPDKALFLMFEDGRVDTAIFASEIIEDLNYKATIMTYSEKFRRRDNKFLMPSDLQKMLENGFWELGSNGHRLFFINAFDRYGNYIGELEPLEFAEVNKYLDRNYNHFLMDYIRDAEGMPRESYNRMNERISGEYKLMRAAYNKHFGFVPKLYVIMHANTGAFGNNERVSAVNARCINETFAMNFNREGQAINLNDSSIYDLTRMQPQAHWSANHVLMRIKRHPLYKDIEFVKGEADKWDQWQVLAGALEVKTGKIIVTTQPGGRGLAVLNASEQIPADLQLSVQLTGNKLGLQKIYLRADNSLQNYLSVYLQNNYLCVSEATAGVERQLVKLSLDKIDGKTTVSVAEDEKSAREQVSSTFLRYADTVDKAQYYAGRLQQEQQEQAKTIAQGAKEYIPAIGLGARDSRKLEIFLRGQSISVKLAGKEVVQDLAINNNQSGMLALEGAFAGMGFSQRNLADDVYDAVFEKLVIYQNTDAKEERVVFSNIPVGGWERFKFVCYEKWLLVSEWMLENF